MLLCTQILQTELGASSVFTNVVAFIFFTLALLFSNKNNKNQSHKRRNKREKHTFESLVEVVGVVIIIRDFSISGVHVFVLGRNGNVGGMLVHEFVKHFTNLREVRSHLRVL